MRTADAWYNQQNDAMTTAAAAAAAAAVDVDRRHCVVNSARGGADWRRKFNKQRVDDAILTTTALFINPVIGGGATVGRR